MHRKYYIYVNVNAKPLTLSFYHRHSMSGTYGGVLRNAGANYNFVFEYTQTAADVWEKAVIHIHPETTQSWDNTNGVSLRISFILLKLLM